ncbi:MAG: PEGA domain-containing protein [Methanomicrobiales archaeon]|nr:PEGA domain-containing protein [Methanomicrobiales archaeon]
MVCVRSFNRLPVVLCLLVMMALLIVPCAADTAMQQYDQTDLRGGDYFHAESSIYDPGTCAQECLEDSRCIGSTYVKPGIQGQYAVCWLKDKAWTKQPNVNTVSFVKMTMQELDQTDLYGADDYRVDWPLDPKMTPQWCSDYCLSKEPCVAATFVKAGTIKGPNPICYLKKAGYDEYRNPSTISFKKIDPSTSFGSSNPTGGGSWESCAPSFEATPLSGAAPLTVTFTDTSPGSRSWVWNFDNTGDPESYVKNPTHTYTSPGVYSVELTIGCTLNLNSITKENLISVGEGSLDVSSTPSGAAIYVDDVYKGVTPLTVTQPPGEHAVRLTKAGYEEHSETVTVTSGQTGRISATLVPQAATTGSLSLTSNPSGARVTLDGGRTGTTPWVTDVSAGSHTLVFSLPGYLDATATVTVQGGDTATYNAVLQKGTGSTTGGGSISVASVPSGATISLDGVPKGVTPTTLQGIPAGSHALALSLPGYETYRRNVDVAEGETSSYVANLIKTGWTTGMTTSPTGRWTDTYPTSDDWDDDDNDDDMPGFVGIGAVIALAAVFLLVAKRSVS